jgi:16S rRNA (uracil1498-N3)-methyltransferase
MRRALCDSLPKNTGDRVELSEAETRHLVSVLRLRNGDEIELLDGKRNRARAELILREKHAWAELLEAPSQNLKLNSLPIHLFMAIIKGEAMEWVIEKAAELGVARITPVHTEFTVVQVQKKGADVFQERWQKIADQALKQCGRLERLKVEAPVSLEEALLQHQRLNASIDNTSGSSTLFWLDESLAESSPETHHLSVIAPSLTPQNFALLVGPEGGFSATEKSRLLQLTTGERQAIKRVHLGALILRAETAALLGVSLLVGAIYGKGKN